MQEVPPACVFIFDFFSGNSLALKLIVAGYNRVMGLLICNESTRHMKHLFSLLNGIQYCLIEKITALCIIHVSMQCRIYDT